MNDLTKEDLETILHWGMDRADAIGVIEFVKEGGDRVYLKIRKILCPELYGDKDVKD
jgi:hypothetical protein